MRKNLSKNVKRLLSISASITLCLSMIFNGNISKLADAINGDIIVSAQAADGDVEINSTNFPDDNFRNWIISNITGANDNVLTQEERANVTDIDISDKNICTLKGIEYFTELAWLFCFSNQLSSLDLSNNRELTGLFCFSNHLSSLDVSNNRSIIQLNCSDNSLSSLDVSQNTELTGLECYKNQLSSLDVSQNTKLTTLICFKNPLSGLDVSNNKELTWLNCYENQLSSLDVSQNTKLTWLDCYENQLSSLDVSNNRSLTQLDCYGNQLSSLDVSNNKELTQLNCLKNQLSSLDVSNNRSLTQLDCYGNQLSSLDVSNNKELTQLNCSDNSLSSLDVSNNKELTQLNCSSNHLSSLDVSNNRSLIQLSCSENSLSSLDVSNNRSLSWLDCDNNQRNIGDVINSYDMSKLNGLDITKMSNILGASIDVEKKLLYNFVKNDEGIYKITYDYDCGNGKSASFSLIAKDFQNISDVLTTDLVNIDLTGEAQASSTKDYLATLKAKEGYALPKSIEIKVGNTILTDTQYSYDMLTGELRISSEAVNGETITIAGYAPLSISGYELILSQSTYNYDGIEKKPAVTLKNGTNVIEATNYTVKYNDNINAGTATVIITGKGNYTGTITKTFTIKQIANPYTFTCANVAYGTKLTPKVIGVKEGASVKYYYKVYGKADSTYTTTKPTKAGTYTVKAVSAKTTNYLSTTKTIKVVIGKYSITKCKSSLGETSKSKLSGNSAATGTLSFVYTGYSIKPSLVVKRGTVLLKAGTDYSVSYTNNKLVGKATLTITGKGNYTGTKKINFKIVPKINKISSLTSTKSGTINVKWISYKSVGGYEIVMSSSKTGTYSRVKSITPNTRYSYTKASLKSGKTYYFKVRSYKVVNGVKYYGDYSEAKSVKVK